MEPVYIHKLPDGTIRRHVGVPVGDGDFILVEPVASTMQTSAAPKKEESKSYLWVYAASALAALAAGAVLWLQF